MQNLESYKRGYRNYLEHNGKWEGNPYTVGSYKERCFDKGWQQARKEAQMGEGVETFQFSNLAELRDWLNRFKTTDLAAILFEQPNGLDYLNLIWKEKTLTDGSKVVDVTMQ